VKFLPQPKKPVKNMDTSISNGAELAGVIIVFFLIGLGIDHWRHTTPWFMVGLTVFGVVGQFIKMYYAYNFKMSELEEKRSEVARGINS
jgi:F0F1-type ATP synthase assembly protein I